MKFGVVIVAAGLAAFSGCGSTTDGSSAPTTASGSDVPTTRTPPSDSPASDSSPVPVTPSFGATLGAPIEGWTEPVDMAALPGATFVVERGGTIRTMAADGSPGPVALDLSALTRPGGEQGLLGLAFSPDGRNAYVNYTNATGDTVIAEFAVRADRTFDESSRRTLLTIAQPYPNHNGGDLLVSPDGSDLLVFTGDGGAAGDPQRLALDPNSFLGKIVRIDPAAPGASASVWAVGLRNPWRVSYDATRGDLWIADVGQDSYEEIDRIPLQSSRGASFGWSAREATHEIGRAHV